MAGDLNNPVPGIVLHKRKATLTELQNDVTYTDGQIGFVGTDRGFGKLNGSEFEFANKTYVDTEDTKIKNSVTPITTKTLLTVASTDYLDVIETFEYDDGFINGGAKWKKTGNTGASGTTNFPAGLLYDANGDERKILIDVITPNHFGAKMDGINDDSEAINSAATFRKEVRFLEGTYLFNGQIVGNNLGHWFGPGKRIATLKSTVPSAHTETTNLQGKAKITGTPHVIPPAQLTNMRFEGTSKNGIGLKVGEDGAFTSNRNWKEVHISGFGLGVDWYNTFTSNWSNVFIGYNERNVQMQPLDGAGDDGYITTMYWESVLIGYADGFGLSCNFPLGDRNFQWNNVVVEGNCQTIDLNEGEISLFNVEINGSSCYFESKLESPCPMFYCYGTAKLNFIDYYSNGTNGVKWESTLTMSIKKGTFVKSSDKTFDGPLTASQKFYFENTPLPTDNILVRSTGGHVLKSFNSFGIAGTYNNGGITLAPTNELGVDASTLTAIRFYTKTLGTFSVPAMEVVDLVTNIYVPGAGAKSTGIAKLNGVVNIDDLILQYTTATTDSSQYFSVRCYNPTGSPIDITGATLLITQFYGDSSTFIPIS